MVRIEYINGGNAGEDEQSPAGARVTPSSMEIPDVQSDQRREDGHSEIPENVQSRDDSALGDSTECDDSREPDIGLVEQQSGMLPSPRNTAEALDIVFCLLLTSVSVYRWTRIRLLYSWLPHFRDANRDIINNIVEPVREALIGPEISAYESEGYWSLPDDFEPDPENQVPNNWQPEGDFPLQQAYQEIACQLTTAEIHAIQMTSGTWMDPMSAFYCTTVSRKDSFRGDWIKLDGALLQSQSLADAGFYFINGIVQCYHCGCSVRRWEDGMIPMNEHVLLSPRCRAVINR